MMKQIFASLLIMVSLISCEKDDVNSLRRNFRTLNYDETDFCKFTNYGFFDFM